MMGKGKMIDSYTNRTLRARNKCKCGHTVYMAHQTKYCICSWCGRKVENNRRIFKEKLKEKLK